MGGVITLTTDFGLADAYVAAMKGVVLGINPGVQLVDITHAVPPRDIARAAFVLGAASPSFPPATIHLAVVDPGVGTARKAVIVRTPGADFVAPDNGVLSYIVQPYLAGPLSSNRRKLKATHGLEAVAITEPRFWRSPVSATFHGRDIFAPVAAHLSLGVPPSEFGEPINSLTVLPLARPSQSPDGTLTGHILQIDSFGNLITDVSRRDLPSAPEDITVRVGRRTIHGLSLTYGAGRGLLALVGSSGYLEISLKDGDAAAVLQARAGDEVKIMIKKSKQ
jgi:S-adenosylmethionine hydrolase